MGIDTLRVGQVHTKRVDNRRRRRYGREVEVSLYCDGSYSLPRDVDGRRCGLSLAAAVEVAGPSSRDVRVGSLSSSQGTSFYASFFLRADSPSQIVSGLEANVIGQRLAERLIQTIPVDVAAEAERGGRSARRHSLLEKTQSAARATVSHIQKQALLACGYETKMEALRAEYEAAVRKHAGDIRTEIDAYGFRFEGQPADAELSESIPLVWDRLVQAATYLPGPFQGGYSMSPDEAQAVSSLVK